MKIIITDITALTIADDILKEIPDFALDIIPTPINMLREQIAELIKDKVNNSLSEFNNMGMLI